MEAYDLYLQGRALLRMRGGEGGGEELIRAIALFEAATESDPDFAPAWAALAIAHQVTEYSLETGVNSQEKAIEVAQRALSLDPHNVDALDALASAKRDTWHWAEAEKYFERAMAIDPQSSELLEDYAEFLGTIGRLEEFLDIAEKGYSIDPLLPPLALSYVSALIANHRTADAIHVIDQRLSSADTQSPAMFGPFAQRKLRSLLVSGDTAAAIEFVNGMIPFQPEIAPAVSALLQNPGNKEARDILRSFSTVESGGPYWGRPGSIILVLAQSGDVDYVIDTEIALRKKIGWGNLEGFWISLYAPVRQHARFEEFLNFVNLPQYWDEAGWPELCQRIDDGRIVCQ